MNILVIEDNQEFVKKAIDVFSFDDAGGDTGNLITTTADGMVALDLLRFGWDWILIDHDLPNRMSGWQLLNNTSEYREKDNARIIAISAVPYNNERLQQHGAHYTINKMDGRFEEELRGILDRD